MPAFDYAGPYAYNLTFVTRQRAPLFRDADLVSIMEQALLRAAAKHAFRIEAFCFMPDHLHVLAVGEDGSQLSPFTKLFKQLSGYAGRKITGNPIWQISYYDHVLRAEEEVGKVARYILNNPVRAGLVDSPEEYPFLGPRPLPL